MGVAISVSVHWLECLNGALTALTVWGLTRCDCTALRVTTSHVLFSAHTDTCCGNGFKLWPHSSWRWLTLCFHDKLTASLCRPKVASHVYSYCILFFVVQSILGGKIHAFGSFSFSPQEASGRGPVGTEPDATPSQSCCFISPCGIISANALVSSHCVETLVLCQTVGQGALNQNIHLRRREVTGIALSHTHVDTHVYYYVVVEAVNLISF